MCGKEERFDVKYYDIPEQLKKGKAEPLYDHIAVCVKDFVENVLHYDKDDALPLGYTFSFPMINLSINCGLLTTWTKSYDIKECINKNPVEFLQASLDKHHVPVKVEVLINDAAGTLMKGIYLNKDCKLGVILGKTLDSFVFNLIAIRPDCYSTGLLFDRIAFRPDCLWTGLVFIEILSILLLLPPTRYRFQYLLL